MYYFDTKINVGSVSVNGVCGEVATRGDGTIRPRGAFVVPDSASDICPNRYNNSQKTHSKFTNCKAVRDYFPPNIDTM